MVYIENILNEALSKGASDIHFAKGQKPILRIKKELKKMDNYEELTEEDTWSIFRFFIKDDEIIARSFEKEKKLDLNFEFSGHRMRVNISLAMKSMVFTIRIIQNTLPSYAELHLPDVLKTLVSYPQGLILITGKSGSGKSTTLNALIAEINNTESKKILTLEKPIEYVHTSNRSLVIQKEIGEGRDCPTFSQGVKNSLREDCDILIVGEIIDRETMDAAIEMSESGHLVIGTMHTRSCAETIDRILNFYPSEDQPTVKNVVSTLLVAVISQRLIKGLRNDLVLIPEVMIVDDVVSSLIRKDKFSRSEIEDAIQTKMDKGSIGLIYALARAVIDNRITLEQAEEQIVPEKHELLSKIIWQQKLAAGKNQSSNNSANNKVSGGDNSGGFTLGQGTRFRR